MTKKRFAIFTKYFPRFFLEKIQLHLKNQNKIKKNKINLSRYKNNWHKIHQNPKFNLSYI